MEKLKQFMLILFASFCIMLATNNADARVCFAGGGDSDDCGSMNSFGDYANPETETGEQCIKAGYDVTVTQCQSTVGKQVTAYCPYNNQYVKCCGLDYAYASCLYPLVKGDAPAMCGSKYRCKCDSTKYPYNSTECTKQFTGTRPGGGTCVQQGYNPSAGGIITDIFYSDCICDVGTYPYADAREIGSTGVGKACLNNSNLGGEMCRGTDGVSRYAACICDRNIYKYTPAACEFGGDESKISNYCIQGGLYYYKSCYSCDAFPANSLDNVAPGGENVSYTKCSYGERYKINKCIKGYRPGDGGSNCRKVNCLEAIDEWLTDNPSYKNRYTLLSSSSEISKYGLQSATASQNDIGTSSSNPKDIIIASEKIALSQIYAGVNYYGGGYFGKMKGGYLADSCKTITYDGINKQSKPNVTYTYSSGEFYIPQQWGWTASTRGYVKLYGIKLTATSLKTAYGFNCVNCDINVNNWTIPATVDYAPNFSFNSSYYTEGYEERPNITVSGTMNVYSYFSSTGYSYNVWRMNLEVPAGYKNREFARFNFSDGQEFNVSYAYLYPTYDDYFGKWGTYVSFVGPGGDLSANVYSNFYSGTDNYKRAKDMNVRISGSLNWNMYKGSSKYNIILSPVSRIYSTDYNSGNYAKIKRGSDSKWGWCKMDYRQIYAHRWKPCFAGCRNAESYSENFFIACSVNNSGDSNVYGNVPSYIGKGSTDATCGSCSQIPSTINWGSCSITAGDWTQHLMSCGDSRL